MSISILIPVYNEINTIRQCITSVCEQNALDVLVLDDCSTDGTSEILQELGKVYSNLNIVRYPIKSQNYLLSIIENMHRLQGTHVISLGADDLLLPNIISNCEKHFDAPIIFHNYYHIDSHDNIVLSQNMGVSGIQNLTSQQVCDKFNSIPIRECGIGSCIRYDCLKWLIQLKFWELGAWCDSIGYGAVAAKYGALYIPEFGAKFRISFRNGKVSYSQQSLSNQQVKSSTVNLSLDFLNRAGIDSQTSNSLIANWGLT